jgi:PPOX class probable F420-dependent enzyme
MSESLFPQSHLDLLDSSLCAALTTLMPDGQPQTTPVWFSREDPHILINTMRDFRKQKNMRGDPRVSLLIFDPKKPLRHIEIRGVVVEMTEDGALEHLDQLAAFYMKKPGARFFGDSVPAAQQAIHVPVKVRIEPVHVRVEG